MFRYLAALVAAALIIAPMPVNAQELSSSIVGVWKMASFTRTEVESGKSAGSAYGERPAGYAHYTKGGQFVIFVTGQSRKVSGSELNDADRLELFKSMFSWGGRYKINGSQIEHQVDISWEQTWVGSTRKYLAEISGKKLTLTTPPFKGVDGRQVVVVSVYERVE